LKFAYDFYFYLGDSNNIRDSVARVVKHWEEHCSSFKSFGYVLGMYSFGLEETNLYSRAEEMGKKALSLNKTDGWSVHTITHVMEMEGRQKEGIDFLESSYPQWRDCGGLACHLSWHQALFFLENGQHSEVINIYDNRMRKTKSNGILDLIDCSSLLFRCSLMGVDVGDRWYEVRDCWETHAEERFSAFNDLHMLLNAVGCADKRAEEKVFQSMKSYAVKHGNSWEVSQGPITANVGLGLAEAIRNWGSKEYDGVIKSLLPIRQNIQSIGGSHAQRDIFNILLIQSSMKSDTKLAQALLSERLELKPRQAQAWRWYGETLKANNFEESSKKALQKYHNLL